MSDIPAHLRFADSHEWARLEADGSVTVVLATMLRKPWAMWCSSS